MANLASDSREATIREHRIENVSGTGLADEERWDFESFKKTFSIKIVRLEDDEMEMDVIGTSPAIVNAFRRILLAEVPTMAIEKVIVHNNTSVFQDEFLAHRLGLIPIKVDPRLFLDRPEKISSDGRSTSDDSFEFELNVKCTKNPKATHEGDRYLNRNIYTSSLKWIPQGNQEDLFTANPIKPVHDDILIAKLSPNQEINMRLICYKGIGRDHAKFSPVATASYRLLPNIKLKREVAGDEARLLRDSFSDGVIELVKVGKKKVAQVKDVRADSCGRNVFRHESLKDAVNMSLIKDHFIFSIESTGALPPPTLFEMSIDILISKCSHFLEEIDKLNQE